MLLGTNCTKQHKIKAYAEHLMLQGLVPSILYLLFATSGIAPANRKESTMPVVPKACLSGFHLSLFS